MSPGGRGAGNNVLFVPTGQQQGSGGLRHGGGLTGQRAGSGGTGNVRCRMTKIQTLPVYRKICYALGGAPYQITGNAIGFFLQIFLLDVVQLEPFYASLILFLGRAWDAITDPVIGFLVSGSPRRKFGKLMPWIVASTPLGVLCYFMLWFSPSNSISVTMKFLWYLAMYCFFETCMSCYHVPYTSLTMFLGGNQRDRDSATAYRMGVEVASTLIGAGIQGQIVGRYHAGMADSCRALNGTLLNNISPLTDTLENTQGAYMIAAMAIVGLYCFSCLVLFFGVKEQPGSLSPLRRCQLPFLSSLRVMLGHTPYTRLLMGFLSASLAFQITQGIFAFFCTHAAGLAGRFQHLVVIMLVAASLSVPFWQCFLVKFGKKTAVILGLSCFIPPLIVINLVTNNFLVFAFMMVVAGFSMTVLYLLPWSMLPDAVDDFKVKNPNCLNLEAFFYSFYVFFNKFAGGLSLGMSTLSLHFAGYKPGDCTHRPAVTTTLRVLIAPVPIALVIISMAVFYCYPINEERRKQLKVEMEATSSELMNETPQESRLLTAA